MSNSRKNLTQEEFINRCKKVHSNYYDYSSVVFRNTRSFIDITCPKHGKFSQAARTHLSGHRCPKCGRKSQADLTSIDNNFFLKKVKKSHGDKYSYPNLNVNRSSDIINIICPDHGLFKQKARLHYEGAGCKKCSNEKATRSFKDYVALANKVHNNNFTYPDGYFINKAFVTIVCKEHGRILKNKNSHLQGSGCRKCFNDKMSKQQSLTTDEFIKRARYKHGNKYNYSKVNYKNNHEKIIIICPDHGEYRQYPESHLSVYGCEQCAHIGRRLTKEEFVKRSSEVHNNKFDYSKVIYRNNSNKVEILCPDHGSFFQSPGRHMNAKDPRGCPSCGKFISKQENSWLDSLQIPKENRHVSLTLGSRKIIVDGYHASTNTVYEFYGDYWHGNPQVYDPKDINETSKVTFGELYDRTIQRENLIKKFGFTLITIWEKDFKEAKNE